MPGGLGALPGSLLGPSYGDCVLSSMLCPGVASTCQGPHVVQQERLLFAPGARGPEVRVILSAGKWEQKWLAKSSYGS